MKLMIQILGLVMLILSSAVRAETAVNAGGPNDADNHFSAVSASACPETVQQSLFEQHAWAAALIPDKTEPGLYQLKLQGVRGHLLYFSEEPFRMGRLNNIRFYNRWITAAKANPKINFKGYMEGTKEEAQNYIFQLSGPSYKGTTVTFQAKLISKAEINSALHFTDVTLLIQIPECASCTEFPCLSC